MLPGEDDAPATPSQLAPDFIRGEGVDTACWSRAHDGDLAEVLAPGYVDFLFLVLLVFLAGHGESARSSRGRRRPPAPTRHSDEPSPRARDPHGRRTA